MRAGTIRRWSWAVVWGATAALTAGCGAGDDVPLEAPDAGAAPDARVTPDARVDVRATPDVTMTPDVSAAPDVTARPDASASPDARVMADASMADDLGDLTPDMTPDGSAPAVDAEAPPPAMGATMRVTATSLNLRSGAGTSNMILTSMPCGARVTVVGGPTSGWWNVRYNTSTGWASGAYLVADAGFDPSVCGGSTTPPPMTGTAPEVSRIFELARSAVGYSYYWGHGSWGTDGTNHGSCSGSCPSCTHSGRYGADCSGFVAKAWQIPSPSPVTTDAHPYSTYNFYNNASHWSRVSRASMRPGDALVYNASGSGHIVLFESGSDPWGNVWVFEARGCATGIVHNLRAIASSYVAIRREGL